MINVNSEIGSLKKVIVHRPDNGIARISPRRAEELLFDDIVHVPKMQEEHDVFSTLLKLFIGDENVLEVQDLLAEALKGDAQKRAELEDAVIDYEELPASYKEIFSQMSVEDFAETLITGAVEDKDLIVFDPIPNFIFTRDIAVTVKDHILVTKAAKEARARENLLTRFVMETHPIFKELQNNNRVINLNDLELFPPSNKGERVSIEGGDIMMLHNDYILIGRSERTTEHAIHSIKSSLFERNIVDNVVQINIPNERYCMHIDTLFTRVSDKDVVAYKPTIFDGNSSNVVVHRKDGSQIIYNSVKEFFYKEIDAETRFIHCAEGETPYQEREQWTDACNLLAIKSGVAIAYDRNPYTDVAFEKAGYKVVEAEPLIAAIQKGDMKAEDVQNTIITIPSSELSRARGGSHCMSCPISRESM